MDSKEVRLTIVSITDARTHPARCSPIAATTLTPGTATLATMSRIFSTSFASVYPHYVIKVEKKGRTTAELDQVIGWLTGFDAVDLNRHLAAGTTFEEFFAQAQLNPKASSITGSVCGVRVESIEDPLMQKIRYLDKLVDELAKGRPMEKILRAEPSTTSSP
jgi:hypothetical protein